MPRRIPRSEFDAECHWELVKAVTGIPVSVESPGELKHQARLAFIRAWNYDVVYSHDDIAACGVAGFFFEPLTDLRVLAERYGQTHVLIGNVDTRALLSGSKARIRAEVERCITIGRRCPGYFIGVTNMIPPNTPVEAALYYNRLYERLSRR